MDAVSELFLTSLNSRAHEVRTAAHEQRPLRRGHTGLRVTLPSSGYALPRLPIMQGAEIPAA